MASLRSQLSRIGLGCTTFGREIDQTAAFALMDCAWKNGVNHFDTASGYSAGVSEQIVGAWLESRRPASGSVLVATKMRAPFDPGRVGDSIRQSRLRLGIEAIDLFYFHQWDEAAADPAVLAALDRAVKNGEIHTLGASNFTADQLLRVLAIQRERGYAPLQALQNNHNYAVSDVSEQLQRQCSREDVAIIAYSPLGAGFLTGKHRNGVEKGSRFDVAPAHQAIYFNELASRRLAQLEKAATATGHSMASLALAWVLHQPGITSVLAGGRRPEHVEQALAAARLDEPEIWRLLAAETG